MTTSPARPPASIREATWKAWTPPPARAATADAPPGTAGAAGGLLNAVRQAGATVGVAVMGALAGAGTTGTAYALLLSAVLCAGAGAWFARTADATGS